MSAVKQQRLVLVCLHSNIRISFWISIISHITGLCEYEKRMAGLFKIAMIGM